MSYDVERDGRFARAEAALESYLARVEAGEPLSFEEWVAERRDLADEIRQLHSICEPLRVHAPAKEWDPEGRDLADAPDLQVAELEPLRTGPNRLADYDIDPVPIAQGGMGAILSIRDRSLKRQLAMKVLRVRGGHSITPHAVDTSSRRVARFLDEARITSQLDHPGIVPVHELGLDAAGRPYFTMKRVFGQTLERVLERVASGDPQWPQARALSALQRVCEAVAFAHERGVIHRDLKPSNVMVGDFGEVYVMDWGLARVLEPGNLEGEVHRDAAASSHIADEPDHGPTTQDGDVLGTPAYMPPEQAEGRMAEVGRHSDVYALGAILYQLLAAHTPYFDGSRRPSTNRLLEMVIEGPPEPLDRAAPDAPVELVAICERAMERDWRARYHDVGAMSGDLSAFLEGRVVQAYETGAWAEARKWVRRNRALTNALAGAVLILVAGVLTTLNYAFAAQREAHRADAKSQEAEANASNARLEAERADAAAKEAGEQRIAAELARDDEKKRADELTRLSEFQSSMFEGIDVELMGLRLREDILKEARASMERSKRSEEEIAERVQQLETLMAGTNFTGAAVSSLERNVLQRALESVDERFSDQPAVRGPLLRSVGMALAALGRYAAAEKSLKASLALRRDLAGDDDPDSMGVTSQVLPVLLEQGKLDEAAALARDDLECRRRILGEDHSDTIASAITLACVLRHQGSLSKAEPLLEEALEKASRILGEDHPNTINATHELGTLRQDLGRYSDAEPLLRDVLERRRRTLGEDHPETLASMNGLGILLQAEGKLSEAEPLLWETFATFRRTLGDDHPHTNTSMNNLGVLLHAQRKLGEAEPLLRDALQRRTRLLGDDHPDTITSMNNLGMLLYHQRKLGEAESLCRGALERRSRLLGKDHPSTILSTNNLGLLLHAEGKLGDAERLYGDALERCRRLLGDDHPGTISTMNNLAAVYEDQGRPSDAEALFRDAFHRACRVWSPDHPSTLEIEYHLALRLEADGKQAEAELQLRDLVERASRVFGNQDSATLRVMASLGTLLIHTRALAEAEMMLLDCERACLQVGDAAASTLKSTQASIVKLYDAMEKASPGQGYAAKADEYRGLLDYPANHPR